MHKLSHCPASELTCLVPANLEQNAQAFHNCSSSNSLWSDDRVYHYSGSSSSLGQHDQLSRNYNILVYHYSYIDVFCCTCYIIVIVQSFAELVPCPELFWSTLISWPTLPLASCLRFPTGSTKLIFVTGSPRLEPKPSTTSLISYHLKWTWL